MMQGKHGSREREVLGYAKRFEMLDIQQKNQIAWEKSPKRRNIKKEGCDRMKMRSSGRSADESDGMGSV
jgi:hypothetical protein